MEVGSGMVCESALYNLGAGLRLTILMDDEYGSSARVVCLISSEAGLKSVLGRVGVAWLWMFPSGICGAVAALYLLKRLRVGVLESRYCRSSADNGSVIDGAIWAEKCRETSEAVESMA